MKTAFKAISGVILGGLLSTAASAATLDSISIGNSLLTDLDTLNFGDPIPDAEVSILDDILTVGDDFFQFVMAAPLKMDGTLDDGESQDTDLTILDADFFDYLGGTSIDLEFDAANGLLEILYDLDINEASSDTLAVAQIGFTPSTFITSIFDLDFEIVTFDVLAATDTSMPPVPLPAGLPLLLAGLGAFAVVRRRQNV